MERSWLCENTANLYKLLREKRHWSGEGCAQHVVRKQQNAGERGRRFFGGK
ncbi:hypothetical protein T11_12071 [Trichinella zimbabwensis]|uniref:Uncharacterized protein n=1 Tax=Trichinella zimbabwensis TaxID=268475 RepID=A0A0V1F3S0_9BILA|nr:hypothetical protein T11_5186 [Trichinella zimbabwensis]KRY94260.1 hypothetical protein T11_12071 [Trichinella zimbabwensis]